MSNGVVVPNEYQYGFRKPENYVFKSRRGLSKTVVEQISEMKSEPEWMRDFRFRALEIFLSKLRPKVSKSFAVSSVTGRRLRSMPEINREILDSAR